MKDNSNNTIILVFILIILVIIITLGVYAFVNNKNIIQVVKTVVPTKIEGFANDDEPGLLGASATCKDLLDDFSVNGRLPSQAIPSADNNHYFTSMPSPAVGPYVLALQPGKISYDNNEVCLVSKLCFSINIEPGKFYTASLWVKDIKETSKSLFNFKFNCNGETYQLNTIGTQVVQPENRSGGKSISGWQKRSVIFQAPSKCQSPMIMCLIYEPTKGIGTRFIAGVRIGNYHPNLHCYPVQHSISFFLSVLHSNTFDEGTKIWKDLSGNGLNFKLDSKNMDCSKGFSLNKSRYIGPCCCKLGIYPNNFTLGWSAKFNSLDCVDGIILFRFDTSMENNNTILVIAKRDSICCSYSQVVVKYLSHKKTFNIGYTNYLSNYIMVVDDNQVTLYKDGVMMASVPDTQLKGGQFDLQHAEKSTFFANKPILINPNKQCVDGVLYSAFLHRAALSNTEIASIYYYFTFMYSHYFDKSTYKCLLNSACKAPPDELVQQFPFKPYTENDITAPKNEKMIQNQKDCIQNKQELAKCKYQGKMCDTKLKHMEVTCEGDAVQNKSILETQELLQALVKAFNSKEKDSIAQGQSTSYNITRSPSSESNYQVHRKIHGEQKIDQSNMNINEEC